MPRTVVIIHGSFGNARENWFSWLAAEVRRLGHTAVVPEFPTPERQNLLEWLKVFDTAVHSLSLDTVLVGHSLGAAFILRILERADHPIAGSFLVSGFLGELGLPDFDKVNADFVTKPVNWARVKRNGGHIKVYNGDNDPYVPIDRGREIALRLGSDLTIIKGGGHINTEAGFTTFPLLLEDLRQSCLT